MFVIRIHTKHTQQPIKSLYVFISSSYDLATIPDTASPGGKSDPGGIGPGGVIPGGDILEVFLGECSQDSEVIWDPRDGSNLGIWAVALRRRGVEKEKKESRDYLCKYSTLYTMSNT